MVRKSSIIAAVVAVFALAGCNDSGSVRTEITDGPLPTATQVTETTTPAVAPLTSETVVEPAAVPVVPRGTRTLRPTPTVLTPAPVVTRHPRPVRTPPAVVTPTQGPIVTANPRPVQTSPVVVGTSPVSPAATVEAPVPVVTRGTRDLADPPVVVTPPPTVSLIPPLVSCPEEDPESCPSQP